MKTKAKWNSSNIRLGILPLPEIIGPGKPAFIQTTERGVFDPALHPGRWPVIQRNLKQHHLDPNRDDCLHQQRDIIVFAKPIVHSDAASINRIGLFRDNGSKGLT